MNRKTNLLATGLIAASVLLGTTAFAQQEMPDLSDWPQASQDAAQHMMDTYGEAPEVTDTMLIWGPTGPWKRTVIYKEETTHMFPVEHPDVMQQWINLDVPPDYFDDLAHYDGSVVANRTEAEISARCDKETANFLAINLAHDIINDVRTVEDARQFYAETMKALMEGGTPSDPAYVEGFIFEVPQEDLSNPDKSLL